MKHCTVKRKSTDISEKRIASNFEVNEKAKQETSMTQAASRALTLQP
jgi:hypothetical protein